MTLGPATLPDDPQILKEVIADLILRHEKQIAILIEEIRLLRDQKFGRKSEKIVDTSGIEQLLLFDEVATRVEQDEEDEQDAEIVIPAHTRKKRGRKPLPEDLPRVEIVHDLPAEAKICGCGCEKSRIGEEVSEQLDVIPAKYVDALPFYRQEKIFSRHGVELKRATMCCWAM